MQSTSQTPAWSLSPGVPGISLQVSELLGTMQNWWLMEEANIGFHKLSLVKTCSFLRSI